MSKCFIPSSYFRKVITSELVRRGEQQKTVGSHTLVLTCGHIAGRQGTLMVPLKYADKVLIRIRKCEIGLFLL